MVKTFPPNIDRTSSSSPKGKGQKMYPDYKYYLQSTDTNIGTGNMATVHQIIVTLFKLRIDDEFFFLHFNTNVNYDE